MKITSNLHEALDVIPNGVLIINIRGIIVYANPGAQSLFEYTENELLNKNVSLLMPSPHNENHDNYIDRYLKTREARIIGIGREVQGLTKSGKLFPMYLSVGEVKHNEEHNFIGIITDLSLQKHTEERLLLVEERSTLAQRFANIGYWDWTISTGDLYWSERIAPMFGYESGALETSYDNFIKAIHPDDREKVVEAVDNSVENGADYEIEHRVVWPDGTVRWLLERGDIIRDSEGKPLRMLGVVQDITNRKILESDLVKARDEAEMAARAKSSFLANMSHEIRTPMNSIIGFIEVALENPDLPEETVSYLQTAKKSSRHLLSLLNDILDISKLEAGKFEIVHKKFYLPSFLKDILQSLKIKSDEKTLDLKLELEPGLFICIDSDPDRIRQILVNLIGNSIKFTPKGSITLYVQFSTENPEWITFSIKDTGIGMTQAQLDNIFQPFSQADESTSRKYGGTGLGTTICKQLVELMGGKIWVQSEPEKGTDFYFSIPIDIPACAENCSEECGIHTEAGMANVPCLTQAYNILLAEDIPENSTLVKIRLEKQGSSVDVAFNGKEAVDLFKKNKYDLILMDIQMPEMDGLEATRIIRKLEEQAGTSTPIVALTASVMPGDRNHYRASGMNEMVPKPVNFFNLFNVIESIAVKSSHKQIKKKSVEIERTDHVEWPAPPEGISIQRGLQRWQNASTYFDALILFKNNNMNFVNTLEKLFQENRLSEAIDITHNIKGVSGNLSLGKLFEITSRMNSDLVHGQNESALNLLPELSSAFDDALNYITKLEHIKSEGLKSKSGKTGKHDLKLLKDLIDQCLKFCSRGEVDDELFSRLIDELETSGERTFLNSIKNSFQNFNLHQLEKLLKQLKKGL